MDRSKKRDTIEKIAVIVRKVLDIATPIDLECAIQKLGGKLTEDASLDCDAKITVHKNTSAFEISYNPNITETRKRFSIAHEIGHMLLHAPKTEDGLFACDGVFYRDSSREYASPEQEWESNEFAAALLMPRKEFVDFCYGNAVDGGIEVRAVADNFNVSIQAADVRGSSLNLW